MFSNQTSDFSTIIMISGFTAVLSLIYLYLEVKLVANRSKLSICYYIFLVSLLSTSICAIGDIYHRTTVPGYNNYVSARFFFRIPIFTSNMLIYNLKYQATQIDVSKIKLLFSYLPIALVFCATLSSFIITVISNSSSTNISDDISIITHIVYIFIYTTVFLINIRKILSTQDKSKETEVLKLRLEYKNLTSSFGIVSLGIIIRVLVTYYENKNITFANIFLQQVHYFFLINVTQFSRYSKIFFSLKRHTENTVTSVHWELMNKAWMFKQ